MADGVAPRNPDLGVMLPYTPLHVLLLEQGGPDVLVMTSGNLAGEPIVFDDADARERLDGIADAWLSHDRRIHVPCDDSVSRVVAGAELPVRRSRGHAPLPVALPVEVEPVLAVGADLKNTCAVATGRYAWLSQHIGDLDDLATQDALTASERHLEELTGVRPRLVVADAHPGYRSTSWAREHAAGRPVRQVQHHHAHIASVMGEHGLGLDDEVIGIAFDGTGYGTDGAVWGGEALVAGYKSFRRSGHLGYVPLAGGDASVLRPYRMALAHLRARGRRMDRRPPGRRRLPGDRAVGARPPAGDRSGMRPDVQHGAALRRGLLARGPAAPGRLRGRGSHRARVRRPLVRRRGRALLVRDRRGRCRRVRRRGPGTGDPGCRARPARRAPRCPEIAARFHAGVAALVGGLAHHARGQTGLDAVALGGGVFVNSLLLDACVRLLTDRGFTVLRPRLLPPNDGGIALGQILVGSVS